MKKLEKISIITSIIALVITIILFNKQNELSINLADYQFEQDLKRDFAFVKIRLDYYDTNYIPLIDANNLKEYSNVNKAQKGLGIQVLNSGNMGTGGIQLFLKNEGLISNDPYIENIPSGSSATFDVKILEKEFGKYNGLVNLTFNISCQNCYERMQETGFLVCIYHNSTNVCNIALK
ncbi:hypothetical protein HYV49_03900 [Candidatus Pacearchaeota archaeon]|nr:hypothetical protein [Candidatus Pacearchaeota archaeon]